MIRDIGSHIYQGGIDRLRQLKPLFPDVATWGQCVNTWEIFRASRVNENYQLTTGLCDIPSECALPSPDSSTYQTLELAGDLWDGYWLTLGIYYTLSIITGSKLSEKTRLGLSAIAVAGIITAVEGGYLVGTATKTYSDIPFGLLGIALFGIAHTASNKVVSSIEKGRAKAKIGSNHTSPPLR